MGVAAVKPHPNVGVVAPRAPLLKFLEITTETQYRHFELQHNVNEWSVVELETIPIGALHRRHTNRCSAG